MIIKYNLKTCYAKHDWLKGKRIIYRLNIQKDSTFYSLLNLKIQKRKKRMGPWGFWMDRYGAQIGKWYEKKDICLEKTEDWDAYFS